MAAAVVSNPAMQQKDIRTQLQDTLGDAYVIERELGGGGMSRVFVALDARLGRRVVIKLLSPDLHAGVSAERFEREIRLAARLQHPHIVPLLAAGDVAGLPFYTMPFVEGASLRERMLAGPPPQAESQSILRDIARALAYAHRQEIVHRDIKPENVLLAEGVAMVADFGVARALSAAARSGEGDDLTLLGTQIGTPAYMAPEQASGDPNVDFRADLYAFGVVAYELFAGRHPFAGRRTAHAIVMAHLTETPRHLSDATPDLPMQLAALVMQCLAKDPADRPESASAVVRALDAPFTHDVAYLTPPGAVATPSIAVLPFTNMSGDPDNEYFSDGITDDIIGALTRVRGLRVAARASAFSFKGRNEDIATIGKALNATNVLQGSVRRAGKRVRVTTQLMSARDGIQLWSERFDRDLDDIFAIQDEIARGIVAKLELTLGLGHAGPLVGRPTEDLAAYELYLRAREAIQQRTPPSMRRALDFFHQAIARDPRYARSHLGVAEAYIGLGAYQAIPPIESRREAEAAIAHAAALDPDLSAIHLLRGQLKIYLRPDILTAADDLTESLRRDPNDPLACAYMGILSGRLGDSTACGRWAARALRNDPRSPFIRGLTGMGHYLARDYEEALRRYEEGLAIEPNSVLCLWQSGSTLDRMGRVDEALRRFQRAVELSRRSAAMLSFLYRSLFGLGLYDEANALVEEAHRRSETEYMGELMWLVPALLSRDEAAIDSALRRCIAAETGTSTLLFSVEQELESLLGHPRLGPLVRQLTLYAEWPMSRAALPPAPDARRL